MHITAGVAKEITEVTIKELKTKEDIQKEQIPVTILVKVLRKRSLHRIIVTRIKSRTTAKSTSRSSLNSSLL